MKPMKSHMTELLNLIINLYSTTEINKFRQLRNEKTYKNSSSQRTEPTREYLEHVKIWKSVGIHTSYISQVRGS